MQFNTSGTSYCVSFGPQPDAGPGTPILYTTDGRRDECIPFPAETNGYLYFDRPHAHITSGALKFRIAERVGDTDGGPGDSVQTAFAAGRNLCLPSARGPWSVNLLALQGSRHYSSVYKRVRADGLVTDEEHSALEALGSAGPKLRYTHVKRVVTVLDPFVLDFLLSTFRIVIVDPEEIRLRVVQNVFSTALKPVSPFSGVGLVRLEASRLGRHRGEDPVVVMCLLEWLKPPPGFYPGRLSDDYEVCMHLWGRCNTQERKEKINTGRGVHGQKSKGWVMASTRQYGLPILTSLKAPLNAQLLLHHLPPL